jgi:hypothetical protein
VIKQLTMHASNLLDRLPVSRVIDQAEIKGCPFREQRIRGSKRWVMNSQQAFEFKAAFLQGF